MRISIYIFLLFVVFVQAQIHVNEFILNTSTAGGQRNVSIAALNDSGFVAIWENQNTDIYAQLFDKNGLKKSRELNMTYGFADNALYPGICTLLNGNFIVTWTKAYGKSDVYAQLYDIETANIGAEFIVYEPQPNYSRSSSVAALSDGGFAITWHTWDPVEEGYNTFCQLFNSDKTKNGPPFLVNTQFDDNSYFSWDSKIKSISNNRFLVKWKSRRKTDNKENGILVKIYNNNGSETGIYYKIQSHNYSNDLTELSNGNIVLCWQVIGQSDTSGIYTQIFTKEGNSISAEIPIKKCNFPYMDHIKVASFSDDKFVITWSQFDPDESTNVYGQFCKNDGSKMGDDFKVNDYATSYQWEPVVSVLKNNRMIICWESMGSTDGFDIIGKYYPAAKNHLLKAYKLLEPKYDSTHNSLILNFKWQKPSNVILNFQWEIEYSLYLDNNENFSSPTIIDSIYDTTYTVQNLTPGTTYFWKVLAKNITGDSLWSSETFGFFVDYDATAIEEIPNNKLQSFQLYANYPNPFNPSTTIRYDLPEKSNVNLAVYDISGRLLQTLVNEKQTAGSHKAVFNAAGLSSGVYFYTIKAGHYRETKKMLLVR